MLTPSFHFNILKDALIMMNEHAVNLRDKLMSDHCNSDESVDIFKYITLSSLDIICGGSFSDFVFCKEFEWQCMPLCFDTDSDFHCSSHHSYSM